MSFLTDPAEYDYSVAPNICDVCYDVGKTPASLFLCFTGIMIGNLWVPGDEPPPNGPWEIPVTGPCRWAATLGGFDFVYDHVMAVTVLNVNVTGAGNVFTKAIPQLCSKWFENSIVGAIGNKYHGGTAQVVPLLEGNTLSIQDIMALISDDPYWAKWCNPKPADADSTVYKFYKGRETTPSGSRPPTGGTNIKIKIDNP